MSDSPEADDRLPLLAPHELGVAQSELYSRILSDWVPWADAAGFRSKKEDGRLLGPFNAILVSPKIGSAFLDWQKVESEHTSLDERTRQVVILSVGSVWGAPYELYAHRAAAKAVGLPQVTIDRHAAGEEDPGLPETERLAQCFTLALTRERCVDDRLFASAKKLFGPRGLVDMIHLIGAYQCVCGMLSAFSVSVPD